MKLFHKVLLTSALAGGGQLAQAQHTQVFTSDEKYLHEGLELFDREKYGAAQEAFRKYISLINDEAKTADAQYYYAISGLYLFHPNAEQMVLDFAGRYPTHPKAATAYYELGLIYFDKKDYKKTIEYLEKGAPDKLDEQQRKESEFKLAYAYFASKEFDKAKLLFDRNKGGNHKYSFASSYYAGYIAYRNGDYATAKTDLRFAEQNDAYKQVVPFMLLDIFYREGNLEEVISYGEQVLNAKAKPQNADDINLLIGDAYFLQGNYAKAAPYFKEYAQGKRTMDNVVRYKIGFTSYKSGDFALAVANLKPIALEKDSLGQNAAYHLGLSYLKENNKPYALTAFDQARRAEFDKGIKEAATLKYAQISYESGNFREVINALADFNKDFPRSKSGDEADDILSEAYLNSSNYNEAIRHIESLKNRSERINRTYQQVTYQQGVSYFNDGKFQEAIQLLDKSLQYPFDNEVRAASHFVKGESHSVAQRWDDAVNSYAAVFRTSNASKTDYYIKSRYGIGYAYYNNKQYDRALIHFKSYVNDNSVRSNNPNYADALIRLADCYYVLKDYNDAITTYDKATAENTIEKDYVAFQKGVIYSIQNKNELAKQTLTSLARNYPNSRYADAAIYQKAIVDFEEGNYAPAIAGFSQLIDMRPTSKLIPNALQKRGVAYVNLRKHNEAIADFKNVLDNHPSSKIAGNALYSLQEALASQNRGEEFDAYLARYKAANPESGATESIEFEAAKNLYFSEKTKQAIPKFEAFLKSYPNSASAFDARYFLADSYLRQNDRTTALSQLKRVIEEGRTEYLNRAIFKVAELEFENKNYPEAIKYYSRLRDVSGNRKEQANALMGMMKSYYLSGDYGQAKTVANQLIGQGNASLNAYNSALLYRAKATYAQGNLDEAIKEFNTVLTSATDENGAEAHYLIAEIQYKQQRYKESMETAFKFNDSFGNYEYWLGKNFLLIADNYVAQNEIFQARGTLTSIIDNSPEKEIVEMAKTKLAALENQQGQGTAEPTPNSNETK